MRDACKRTQNYFKPKKRNEKGTQTKSIYICVKHRLKIRTTHFNGRSNDDRSDSSELQIQT